MLLILLLNVLHLFLPDFSPADGASLNLRSLVLDLASELVFLLDSLHEPVPRDADQVESVEALVNADQILSVREAALLLLLLRLELLQAYRAPADQRVVVVREDVSKLFVQLVEVAIGVFALSLVRREFASPKPGLGTHEGRRKMGGFLKDNWQRNAYSFVKCSETSFTWSSSRPLLWMNVISGGLNGY